MPITFRPITREDIPLLHRWRNTPHVSQWWDPPTPSYALAQEEYSAYMRPDYNVAAYMVVINGKDAGYIQRWGVKDFPDYKSFVDLTDDMVGIDVFIGDTNYLHKGYGPRLIKQFLCDYVFSDPTVTACIIDPLPENKAAIRAYGKAGFIHKRTFISENKGVYLMELMRQLSGCTK